MAGPSSWENMMRRKSAQQGRFFGGIGDFLSKPFREEAASQVEPTIGPPLRRGDRNPMQRYWEDFIRQERERRMMSELEGGPRLPDPSMRER